MTSLESRFFRLLDGFAKSEYRCSLAEMWLRDERNEYVLCFRPLGASHSPEKQHICCYIEVGAREAMKSAREKLLTTEIVDDMKKSLSGLWDSAQ